MKLLLEFYKIEIMVKQFILIRHGEGEHQTGKLIGGWTDVNLTEKGFRQAAKTAERVRELVQGHTVRLVSSDLLRASLTAKPIAELLDVKQEIIKDLREISRGDAHFLSKSEAKKIFIPVSDPVLDWIPYPNAESWRMLQDRVYKVYEDLKNSREEIVIIVSHKQAQICFTHAFLELPRDIVYNLGFGVDNCSITVLTWNEYEEKTIELANDTCHLF